MTAASGARLPPLVEPAGVVLAALLIALGLFVGLPAEGLADAAAQGRAIALVHRPALWLALIIYALMAGASAAAVWRRNPLANLIAKAAAPVGAGFTLIALVAGALMLKPLTDTWWAWDVRLSALLVLYFLYLGYMALWQAIDDAARASKLSAILALVGFASAPVIKFSLDWWHAVYEDRGAAASGGGMVPAPPTAALVLVAAGFAVFVAALLVVRVRSEIIARRVRSLRLEKAAR